MSKKKKSTFEGRIAITRRGVGYVRNPLFKQDVVIPVGMTHTALDGDTVKVLLESKDGTGRQSGKIIEVIDRNRTLIVGNITTVDKRTVLVADNPRIHTNITIIKDTFDTETPLLEPDTKVVVALHVWDNPSQEPEGVIVKRLGKKGEHNTEMLGLLYGAGFTEEFPEAVEREALLLEKEGAVKNEELRYRRDYREAITFTIDPVDAKDFDDALSVKTLPGGAIEIGVHIADVSHYVREGSAIDEEARKRALSVYLVDRCIPMLPEILSNDLCSLREGEDKRTFSGIFTFTKQGELQGTPWYGKTLINSNKRFTYEEAQHVLDNGVRTFASELTTLNDLAKIFATQREKSGAIAFDTNEVRITLDEAGSPLTITAKKRLDTHRLVEEWMLLMNRHVAEHVAYLDRTTGKPRKNIQKEKLPFLYRIHETPDVEKIEMLNTFLRTLGYEVPVRNDGIIDSRDINRLLEQIEGHSAESLVKLETLRAMAKAVYSPHNRGHFGLAFDHYTHFTSPIRRYIDLAVHRIFYTYLRKEQIGKRMMNSYHDLALWCTEREVQATKAERASIERKQMEYMSSHIGTICTGVITGITEWGMYVRDNETLTEGLVRMRDLPGNDYYELVPKSYHLKGKKFGRIFALGDAIRFSVDFVNIEERTMDCKVVDT